MPLTVNLSQTVIFLARAGVARLALWISQLDSDKPCSVASSFGKKQVQKGSETVARKLSRHPRVRGGVFRLPIFFTAEWGNLEKGMIISMLK